MAGAKEIRTKIASVKSTQKITSAMEMVAAAKMRKAQDRMEQTRPYAEKMHQVIGHVALSNPEYNPARIDVPEAYVKHRYLILDHEDLYAALGHFPATFGRGLILRSYEDVDLEHDDDHGTEFFHWL